LIWIIGGTSETKSLIRSLTGKKEYIISVATYSGAEMLTGENVIIGRMNQQAMLQFIKVHAIDTVVDMSHPYALEVTKNAKAACDATDIKYVRYNRKASGVNDCIYVESIDACVELVKGMEGCVFFTTGIKNIKDFEKVKGKNRFVYRVLPSIFSIQECVDSKVKMEDIVAILGSVSEVMNYSMFKEFKADYVMMKDSGKEGGTLEKIQACKRLGITPVVIGRQASEAGVESIEELLRVLLLD
jgi:precorrin-6A/cobalt-precorrin-6A reductase